MDSTKIATTDLEDYLKKLDEADSLTTLGGTDCFWLPDEVRFSDLRKMNDANLAGRLAYYERDYTFEMNPRKRREFHREVVRSKIEMRRRVLERRDAAVTQALPATLPGDIEPAVEFVALPAPMAMPNWRQLRAA
jgi:hypothetical protein